jgi:hypothetical protein
MAKLGIIKPQDAGFSAVVLANPREEHRLYQQLGYLEDQSKLALQAHHYAAIENAKQTHEDLVRNTHVQVSSGMAKVLNGINQINQNPDTPPGSPGARSAFLQLTTSNDPDIAAFRGTGNFQKLLKPYTDLHDVSEQRLRAARDAFKSATGQEPYSVETTATGGINIRGKSGEKAATVPAKTLADYTTLKAARAEKQSYLDKEKYQPNIDKLKSEIAPIDAQINAVEQMFPQLNPNKAAPTGAAAPTIPSTVPAVADREKNKYYDTPKGSLKWTGTGWVK